MLKNYFKIAYRNLIKNKVFSVINILGLAIGMAACLLILQYVSFELSYDDFRRPDIYRVIQQNYMNGELVGQRAQTTPALAPALGNDIPEVIRSARLVHTGPLMSDPVMQVENRSFHEENIYYADSSFLTMFSYQMIAGDADEALTLPSSIVISESMANKYFPGQNAIDQLLTFHRGDRGSTLVKVTGIYADIPKNSHLHTDFLISFSSLPRNWNLDENWGWGNFYNYVEVVPGTNPNLIKDKITTVIENYQGEKLAAWRKAGYVRVAGIQPIQNIHLDSDLEAEVETNGSRRTVEFLTLIAFFILVIAWINYLNLTTAKSVERAKEIGIRKVVGSSRKQLISQILAESLVVTLLATTLAFTLSQLLMPAFRSFTQGSFTIAFNTELSVAILILFLIGSLLAGLYPAFVLSSYRPLSVLKGNTKNSKKGIVLRKGLVIFQFAASIALIAGTFIVQRQLDFMREQDLGLNMDQTLIVKGPGLKDSTYQQQLEYFRNEASKLPQLNEIARSSNVPGQEVSWGREFHRSTHPENPEGIKIVAVDEEFFDLYEANFRAGRNFSRNIPSDRGAVIFNETAIRLLGFETAEEAIQQPIVWNEADDDKHTKTIVGIVEDFNQESLHQSVGPMVFVLKRYLNAPWAGEYFSLKISDDYSTTLANIRQEWTMAFPNSPFDYFFLDDYFDHQYQADQQFGRIFSLFAGLAIFIACLGLFGLSSYVTLQRTREIGIRKVLGASTQSIITLLSHDFIRLVAIASILILPIVYILTKDWLENYAYRMEIQWWLLALPVVLVWLLALITVSVQIIKTTLANPVESLRYE